jgi:hypothetical protein
MAGFDLATMPELPPSDCCKKIMQLAHDFWEAKTEEAVDRWLWHLGTALKNTQNVINPGASLAKKENEKVVLFLWHSERC